MVARKDLTGSFFNLLPASRSKDGEYLLYETLLHDFEAVDAAQVLIIDNRLRLGATIDRQTALQVAFAMLRRKPIILFETPEFDQKAGLFMREVIMSRLSKVFICPLPSLERKDSDAFLASTAEGEVNYMLTRHETILIRSQLRLYFQQCRYE